MKRTLLLLSSLVTSILIGLALLSTLKSASADSQAVTNASSLKNAELSASLPLTNSEPFELVGHIGGMIDHVAVSGTYAYANVDKQLVVLDVSNPAAIALVDQSIKLDAEITDIDIYHGHLFVSATDGLYIYDLSNPSKPHALSVYPQVTYRTDFLGNYAYSLYLNTLSVLDISDPSTPTLASAVNIPSGKSDYQPDPTSPRWSLSTQRLVSAESVYQRSMHDELTISDTTRIYSMADPLHPTQIVEIPKQPALTSERDLPDFLLTKGTRYFTGDSHLNIYETADPNHIITLTTAPLGIPGYAEWVDTTFATEQDNYIYLSGRQYNANHQIDTVFQIIDISNPTAPAMLGGFATAYPIKDMEVAGDYVYATDGDLHIIDIHNPQAPVLVGSYADVGKYFYESSFMVAQGGYVYLAGKEFLVVDTRNPASPKVVGRYSTLGTATSLAISGTRAYLTLVSREGERWLRILDISDPTNPTRLGSLYPHDGLVIQVVGERLYTVNGEKLVAIDISQPFTPTVAATITTLAMVGRVAIIGNYAYVVRGVVTDAVIIDLTEQEIINGGVGRSDAIKVKGNRLYTSGGWQLHTYEVNNPLQPEMTGSYCSDYLKLWAVDGDWLFTTNLNLLKAYDLSRYTSNPFPVTEMSFLGRYDAIDVDNGLLIVRKAQSLYFFNLHEEYFVAGVPIQAIWLQPEVYFNWQLGPKEEDNRTFVNYPVSFWNTISPIGAYPLTITLQAEGLPPQVEIRDQPPFIDNVCSSTNYGKTEPISWTTPGTKVFSLTAENMAGTAFATTTLEIMSFPPITITPDVGATLRYCDLINYPSNSMSFCPSIMDFPAGSVTQTTQIQMTPYYGPLSHPVDFTQFQEEDRQWIVPIHPHPEFSDQQEPNLESFTIEITGTQASGSEIVFSQPFSVSKIVIADFSIDQILEMTQFHLRRWNGENWERVANAISIKEGFLEATYHHWYAITFQVHQTGLYSLFGERVHDRSLLLPLLASN